jgi:hypothetical protein
MTSSKYVPEQVMQQAEILARAIAMPVTPEALAEREQLSAAAAQTCLDEAVESGLMVREYVLVGYSALYVPTAAGRQLARKHENSGGYTYPRGLRAPRITIKDARHTIACAGVMAALEHRYPDYRVIAERELHRDEREQGRRLASVDIQAIGGRRSHAPDLVAWPPAAPGEAEIPLPVAVEVELSRKSRDELMENLRAWARCRYVEAVIYFAETRKIEEELLDGVEELRAEEAIVVNPLSEILKPLPGFPLTDE